LKKLDVDLRNVPGQCSEAAGADEAVHAWLFKTLALFSQVAWGDRGPASGQQKTAWFDLSDLALFCQLKQDAFRLYGPDAFNDWRNKQVGSLPGAQELADGQALAKSIFSINCEALRSL
jgi:hypothetical protein